MKYGFGFEWGPGFALLGGALALLVVPSFALIGLVVVAFAAVAGVVALAGAILASPYLLVRTVRRHLAARRESTTHPVPMATPITARSH